VVEIKLSEWYASYSLQNIAKVWYGLHFFRHLWFILLTTKIWTVISVNIQFEKNKLKIIHRTKTIYNFFMAREGCKGTSLVFESSSHPSERPKDQWSFDL